MNSPDELLGIAEDAVRRARAAGADHAEAYLSEGRSIAITRKGALATPKESHNVGISLRVAVGQRLGTAGSSGLHRLDDVIADALHNARGAPKNKTFRHFARPQDIALAPTPVHPRIRDPEPARLEDLAEAAMDGLASAETTFSAVHISSGIGQFVVANSEGVAAWDRSGRESALLENRVTRGDRSITAWDAASGAKPLDEQTDLHARAVDTTRRARDALAPLVLDSAVDEVLLDVSPVGQIIQRLLEAFSGETVRSKQSPFSDRLGEAVAADTLTIHDDPAAGNTQRLRVDHEGVPTSRRTLVHEGRLESFLYDTLTGDAAGCGSTGHGLRPNSWSGGVRARPIHPSVAPGHGTLDGLIAETDRALLINDSMTGMFTANPTTGDFSATVPYAFLIERGEVKGAVTHCSVGGNLHTMIRQIRAIGGAAQERRTGTYPPIRFGGVSCAT